MWLAGRSLLVTLIATALTGLPMAVLLTLEMDADLKLFQGAKYVFISLLGNLLIGLPMALFCYCFVLRAKDIGLGKLLLISNAIAIVLGFILFILGGNFSLLFLGLPVWLAANTFAVVGWFLVVKPQQYRV
jgi:hypothetical protein